MKQKYDYPVDQEDIERAKELQEKYPELLGHLTHEQLAIMWGEYSDRFWRAGWMGDESERMVKKMLQTYKLHESGVIVEIIARPKN